MAHQSLTNRQLNRATLARQMLLARAPISTVEAVSQLAGLQAQLARPPFIGLWTRLERFERADLIRAVLDRTVVRATTMRATLHLMTAADYSSYRAALQPALDRALSWIAKRLTPADRDVVGTIGREFFATAASFDALREQLTVRYPQSDHRALAYAVRLAVPLVQVPAEGDPWGYPSAAPFVLAERWLKKPLRRTADTAGLVRLYLAAFGPASASDIKTWSGLPTVKDALTALSHDLVAFRDERQRELFDLADAPRPDPETPAPVRFLPDFDNLVLAHDDRSRLIASEHRPLVTSKNLQIAATFLVDGIVAGTWKIARKGAKATLTITPFAKIVASSRRELESEGARLLAFAEPDAKGDVQFAK